MPISRRDLFKTFLAAPFAGLLPKKLVWNRSSYIHPWQRLRFNTQEIDYQLTALEKYKLKQAELAACPPVDSDNPLMDFSQAMANNFYERVDNLIVEKMKSSTNQ